MHFLLAFDELSPIYLKKECLTGVESAMLFLPPPLTRRRVFPPLLVPGGGSHSLAGEGVGGPNSDVETDSVVL
jgi:hypothetical protein